MATASTVTPAPEAEPPKSFTERFGTILTVALAALATVFAGMSAAALQRSMYWKAQAAQDQAKSTNQWTLAGFKRGRALTVETAAAGLGIVTEYQEATFTLPPGQAADPAHRTAKGWLDNTREAGGPPEVALPEVGDEKIAALLTAIHKRQPEAELEQLAKDIAADSTRRNPLENVPSHVTINAAIDGAEAAYAAVEQEWTPYLAAAAALANAGPGGKARAARQAALYELERRRYKIEAKLNQGLGRLYDARVHISSAESDKYYTRSTWLTYASMITQAGVILASLAMARKGSFLWILAALVGVVALGIGGYAMGLFALLTTLRR